jgi:hypothetical protein
MRSPAHLIVAQFGDACSLPILLKKSESNRGGDSKAA